MTLPQIFRAFLLSDAILTTASIVTGYLMVDAPTGGGSSEPLLHSSIEIAVLMIWLTALIALWRFRNWGKALYIAVASIGLLASLVMGSDARGGMEALLNALCWLVTGVILSLVFWSPIAADFIRNGRTQS